MLRGARAIATCLLAVAVLATAGCRSTSTNLTGPSSTRCAATLSGTGLIVPGTGGTGTVSVSLNRECSWTAVSDSAWIVITSGSSGQGPGTIAFSVPANPAAVVRRGGIGVGGQRVEIQQDAAPCLFRLAPTDLSVPASATTPRVAVDTLPGCSWTATSPVPWATIAAGASGSGPGEVTIAVSQNTGAPRSATLTIAGLPVVVSQAGPSCSFDLAVSATSFPAAGGAGSVTVNTAAGCEWTASSDQPWLALTGATAGTGPGLVTFAVGQNPGGNRTATLVVAGRAFTISQLSSQVACSFAVSPASRSVGGDGGTGTFDVMTAAGCEWSATSNVGWLSILGSAIGVGNGTVVFSAAFNSGPARTGTLSIAGQLVTVTQAATTCSFAVSPASLSLPAAGGTTSVNVATGSACAWTATSNAPWLAVVSGASGTGNGTVSFTATPNDGATRQGTLTVAGQLVTVTQGGAACSYAVSPTSLALGATGGTATVTVSTATGCTWTAASNSPWVTVTAGNSGSGSGTVTLAIAENTGPARTATVAIAGQSVVVTQAAAAATCTFTIAPVSQAVPATGGTITVTVTTQPACVWTATSTTPWITVATGATGTGPGTVTLTVAPNPDPVSRNGTATIAGQAFTVSQAPAACTYVLSPTNARVGAAAGTGAVDVSTAAGCAWTATSNVTWLSITSGTSGSGSGRVTYAYTANAEVQERTGTLTIAGRTFTVTQDRAACSYVVAPTTLVVPNAGGTASISVSAAAACSWTAVSGVPWINVTSGAAGTGPGTVTIQVPLNTSGSARTGTLTVAGQTITVTQP